MRGCHGGERDTPSPLTGHVLGASTDSDVREMWERAFTFPEFVSNYGLTRSPQRSTWPFDGGSSIIYV
jgi:hypothetical protein